MRDVTASTPNARVRSGVANVGGQNSRRGGGSHLSGLLGGNCHSDSLENLSPCPLTKLLASHATQEAIDLVTIEEGDRRDWGGGPRYDHCIGIGVATVDAGHTDIVHDMLLLGLGLVGRKIDNFSCDFLSIDSEGPLSLDGN